MFLLLCTQTRMVQYIQEISDLLVPFIHHFWLLVLIEKIIDENYQQQIKDLHHHEVWSIYKWNHTFQEPKDCKWTLNYWSDKKYALKITLRFF